MGTLGEDKRQCEGEMSVRDSILSHDLSWGLVLVLVWAWEWEQRVWVLAVALLPWATTLMQPISSVTLDRTQQMLMFILCSPSLVVYLKLTLLVGKVMLLCTCQLQKRPMKPL